MLQACGVQDSVWSVRQHVFVTSVRAGTCAAEHKVLGEEELSAGVDPQVVVLWDAGIEDDCA